MYLLIEDGLARYLPPLLATGLYGESEDEVLTSLLREAIQNAVASQFVAIQYAKVEAETAEVFIGTPTSFKCNRCQDGAVWHDGEDRLCPKCGADRIPF